jgi:hypothetical protein
MSESSPSSQTPTVVADVNEFAVTTYFDAETAARLQAEAYEFSEQYPNFSASTLNNEAIINELEFQLINELEKNPNVVVDSIENSYISQEQIDEMVYNSKENEYFGYKISDLNKQFGDVKYVFTVENGKTDPIPFEESKQDEITNTIIKNVAVGSGVIVLCATISIFTAGVGTSVAVSTANVIFTFAAKSAASGAALGIASGGIFSGASEAITQSISGQELDWSKVGTATAIGASEGYKWGAIVGSVTGGIQGSAAIKSASGNVGTYKELTKMNATANAGSVLTENHHVIPDAISNVSTNEGLCIRLPKDLHRALTSTGNSAESIAFRGEMTKLLDAGKLKEAYTMGLDDIVNAVNQPQFAHYKADVLADIVNFKALTGLF